MPPFPPSLLFTFIVFVLALLVFELVYILRLRRALSVRNDALARISHDLRTPLAAVQSLTTLHAERPDIPADLRDALRRLASLSRSLLCLAEDALDFAGTGRKALALQLAPCVLRSLLDDVSAQIAPLCQEKGLLFPAPSAPECPLLLADRARLERILLNLLSNAVKYTPAEGKVTLESACSPLADGRMEVTFRVCDTGCGMSAAFQHQLFDAYAREHPGDAPGAGLGLSIVHTLVQQMGGSVHVTSAPNKGSCFCVRLPLSLAPDEANNTPERSDPPALNGLTLLLAEDQPLLAETTRLLLERDGARVLCAPDGRAALNLFAAAPEGELDALLLDLHMPRLDGLSAARAVRALSRADARTVRLVALTGAGEPQEAQRALDAGMDAYLLKPLDLAALRHALSDLPRCKAL